MSSEYRGIMGVIGFFISILLAILLVIKEIFF